MLGIPFSHPYDSVKDSSDGIEWTRWFVGGRINLSEACVDRWAGETPDATAIVAEREDGTSSSLTYGELADAVGRCAGALAAAGVEKGDAVGVYLPMSPEAVVAFLAVARIGAIFVPIFSGYGPDAVADRLTDPPTKALVCADGFHRRGRLVEMKEVADQALERAGQPAETVLMVRYVERDDAPRMVGRDVDWAEALERADPAPATPTESEDPVMLAYTSGTTGRPKGAIHVHGGLTVKMIEEGAFQTDLHPDDRLMWVTDMGWIMGPWMVIAGLGNGGSIVTYDGAPDHPGPDRVWEIVAKHRITVLGLSPTFVRAIQPHGAGLATRHDLSSLVSFGSTGEPWNPDPWWWLFRDVGGERVPIVNIS
ncbi:MAG: AMP-binding protein, partial [Acidimicrobiia bacterium]|nr:AMP-binding protein [Acidimicrobiia bacterium]